MSETQTRQQQSQQPQGKKLALAKLQTVKWVASQPTIKGTYDTVKPRYTDLKQVAFIGWIIAFYEMVVVTVWNFVHNLPWPQVVLSLLDRVDAAALRLLDYTQQKLEWWWDATGVRLMWLRESLLSALDRYVTFIDKYLLWFQDTIIAFVSALLRPVTVLYKFITAPTRTKEQRKQQQRKSGAVKSLVEDNGKIAEGGRQGGSTDLESDMAEDDDDTEDFPSDASEDSTRRKQSNGKEGLDPRHTPEGRLRQAMYRRVRKELRVMRRNSIRLSCGLVNYAKQVMEPRVLPYAASFQDYYQKWAREHEIQELTTPLQEEWNSEKRPLGKVLGLVRALCVVCLAFLLRLAKGKKSRRTRSMRSESLRRRAQNLACTAPPLPLSPSSALQQSSEPAPSPPLEVPENLQEAALKEEDEDLDGSQAKDSALGSELDNPSDHQDSSDHAISPIDEEQESEYESQCKKEKEACESVEKSCPKEPDVTPQQSVVVVVGASEKEPKKGVTIMSPKTQKNNKRNSRTPNKKNVTISYGGNFMG